MCAALLCDVEEILEIKFVDPASIQAGKMPISKHDIIADLPYDKRCKMWFDHHESSKPKEGQVFEGSWAPKPSAARVIYDYYENPYLEKYERALEEVDKIDSGKIALEEVKNPSGWFLISNTFETNAPKKEDDEYRLHAISLIRKNPDAKAILEDEKVAKRAAKAKENFEQFSKILKECTVMEGKVAFSDLRGRADLPPGNNYLVYSLFPDAISSVRLMPPSGDDKDVVKISVGHNIFGEKCSYDVGAAMKRIGGGGHLSVGGAKVKKEDAEAIARKIIKEINEFEANQRN
jgi:oligoribonuclease NrnB/cAMP/cGMP phosphodiesterase (DHH superfamily)